jgi:hypothetical protein
MAHPVLEKKLFEDGIWDTHKEILGWLFDGMAGTVKLLHHKCTELLLELKTIRRLPQLEVKRFQKLHGRLQFVTIAIPCGKPILGQLNWYMSSASKHPGRNHSRNQRARGYPPRLVSTNPTRWTPPHARHRTRQPTRAS